MLRIIKTFFQTLLLLAIISCNLGLTKCEDVEKWELGRYKVVQLNCLGPAGPRYDEFKVYKDGNFLSEKGGRKDSCIITFQAQDDLYLIFNTCQNLVVEKRPEKKQLVLNDVDSIQIFSNQLNQFKLLSEKQIKKFVKDWNKSKACDYRDNSLDSIFFPTYQYKVIVYTKGNKKEFLGATFLITDRTHWTYYISKNEDLKYFDKFWGN